MPRNPHAPQPPTEKLWLEEDELKGLTGYGLAAYQKKYFDALGIPAHIRPDNTLSVVRQHLLNPPRAANSDVREKRVREVRKVA